MDVLITFWLVLGAIAIASVYFRYATARSRDQVIQAMAEKGQPLPPDFFTGPRRRAIDHRTFTATGILLLGLAAGAMVFFLALASSTFNSHDEAPRFVPFLAAFPFFIGIACLVVGRYLKSHE